LAKLPIIYWGRTGDTKKIVHFVSEKSEGLNGIEEELREVRDTESEGLLACDGIIIGSNILWPPRCGDKSLLDERVKYRGLGGEAELALTSSAGPAGGSKSTIWDILQMWPVHGMIAYGNSQGEPYSCECRNTGGPNRWSKLGRRVRQG